MEAKDYLIFTVHGLRYGIDARAVSESLWLAELTPVAEAPPHVVGVLNLRGKIMPVMDLDLRLGYAPRPYRIADSVVIIQSQDFQMGLIVNDIDDVRTISPHEIEVAPGYGRNEGDSRFIKDMARVDENIIMLLDHNKLVVYSEEREEPDSQPGEVEEAEAKPPEPRRFCPEATDEERKIFQERARNLMQAVATGEDLRGATAIAVFALGGEYLGVRVEVVREFCDIREVIPIPCCPRHILGNMNLRGEILTLVDIRSALLSQKSTEVAPSKAIVVAVNDMVLGIPVDDLFEVLYLRPSDIAPVPTGVQSKKYFKGTVPYQGNAIMILDLPRLLLEGNLVVEETV